MRLIHRLLAPLLALGLLAPVGAGPAAPALAAPPAPVAYLFASDADGDGDIYSVTTDGRLANLTANREPDWDPALAPAGTGYAFVSRRDGNSEVYVASLDGRVLVNLTQNPAPDYEPAWSPDGRRLAFVSERDGGRDVYVKHLLGGDPERLTVSGYGDICRSPAWSPDGHAIAYSCVRQGIENVFVRALGGEERQVTAWPLKGRFPAWSGDGRLAFAGWHQDDRPGIYLLEDDGGVRWLWQGTSPLSNLTWAGETILFTEATASGFVIRALGADGSVSALVDGAGWQDCVSAAVTVPLPPVTIAAGEEVNPLRSLPPVMGANLADLSNAHLVRQLGFGWLKNYVSWAGAEPSEGEYFWEDADNIVRAGERAGLKVLLRVHETPAWARPEGSTPTHPPSHLAHYRRFLAALAWRYRGRVAAYEIGNEPNLAFDWGGEEPRPERYAALLRLAYATIKAVDPRALVVSGGLATTGDGGDGAMGDLAFLRGMYRAGAQGYFDALGSHPYGYGLPPLQGHQYGLSVRRLEQQHQVMLDFGDAATPVWATETGWPVTAPWSIGEHDRYAVPERAQAVYHQQLYLQGAREWPWLEGIFLFNLDFSTVPWYEARQPMRWFAILEGDGSPRLAFTWLRGLTSRQMP